MYLASKHSIFAILEKSENCFEYLSSRMGDTVQSGTSTVDISFLPFLFPFAAQGRLSFISTDATCSA